MSHLRQGAPGAVDHLRGALQEACRIRTRSILLASGRAGWAPDVPGSKTDMAPPITAFAATDRGLRRENNEDSYLMDDGLQLYVVADGMGGANGGEVASRMAVLGLREAMRTSKPKAFSVPAENPRTHPMYAHLPRAVKVANRAIHARSEREALSSTPRGCGQEERRAVQY